MISNKIGHAPAHQNNVRQSSPQRQNVAFGTGCSDIKKINSEDKFLKRCILAVPLVITGIIAAIFGADKALDPQNEGPQKAVVAAVSDTTKTKEFIAKSKSMDYFTARDYLIAVADSASGSSEISPSKKFAEALSKIKK